MNTKKFIPSIGDNNTVKIYNATTGQLHRIINVEGNIISQPICLDNEMYVTIKRGNFTTINYYTLPGGSLKKTQPL
jgi:hypothetical protein